ncbi:MAG: RES family NAD+ phosphorylase [Gemmatimonadaceae bacterium]|nr:RES family NAD+ phosphorylase [Gemmatimonadaceae bacterium]
MAIADAAVISDDAASDIQHLLAEEHGDWEAAKLGAETEFASDACYERTAPSDAKWQAEWREFERILKTESRHFSRQLTSRLAAVFTALEGHITSNGTAVVATAGPDTGLRNLYRARVFQSDEGLRKALMRPDVELGPPPPTLALAGRMNARGISVFYGANSEAVAIAEVRPPVGSSVVTASFEILRPLRLLDLSAAMSTAAEGSVFDESHSDRMAHAMFLRSLCKKMTRPIMPSDESMEYLATQAIADYLATEHEPKLDGIMYPSVQVNGSGINIVLFHGSSRVESLNLPPGVTLDVSFGHDTMDGWEDDYSVTEQIPPETNTDGTVGRLSIRPEEFGDHDDVDYDGRLTVLRVDTTSVNVHHVFATQVHYHSSVVQRYRWRKEVENPIAFDPY